MELNEILSRCDHTLLRQDATMQEIRRLCDEAIRYHCASVCIPPCHVAGAKRYVGGNLPICTVIGFPNGYSTTAVKVAEAKDAIAAGAAEIDMVVNLSMVKDGCWDDVLREIIAIRDATAGYILKVIIETCLLTQEEKIKLCELVSSSGADYIKTSTGFSTGGATREDVALLRQYCGPHVKVKAAGGIKTIQDAEDMIALGADRLGTSRIVKLVIDMENAPAPVEEPIPVPVEEPLPEEPVPVPVEEPAPAEEPVPAPAEEPLPEEPAPEAPAEEPAPETPSEPPVEY